MSEAPIRVTAERLRWLEACEAMLRQIGEAKRKQMGDRMETQNHFAFRLQRMARQPLTYGEPPVPTTEEPSDAG